MACLGGVPRGVARAVGVAATAALLSFATSAFADMIPQPAGQSLSLTGTSNPRTVQIATSNPAAPVTSDLGGFWFGLGGAGIGYEVGDFANLVQDAKDLQHDIENCKDASCNTGQVETRANTFMGALNDDAVVKLFANAQPPFMPMGTSFSGLGGVFTLGAGAVTSARLRFVGRPNSAEYRDKPATPDDPSTYNTASAHACTGTDCELVADLAVYGKAAAGGVISLGYSAQTLHRLDGSLYVGGRANYYRMDFSRGMVELASSGDHSDYLDNVKDEFKRRKIENSKLGLDAGVMWAAYNFRAGATVRNLNEPEFAYPDIGTGCAPITDTSPDAINCRAVSRLGALAPGEILLHDVYKMKRQLQFETAVYDSDRTLSAAVTYDANAAPDATGDDYKWLGASASFSPRGWGFLVPALRAGYRKNQAGSKLRMVTAGLSLFRVINLDAAMALDKVDNNGSSIPRSGMVNLSFELYF